MWSGYYYKILDAWTTPLLYIPRWFEANAYPTLSDDLTDPVINTFGSGASLVAPSGTVIPNAWLLNTSSPSTSGSFIQKFFEIIVNEKEFLHPFLIATQLTRSFYFDIAEPEYAYLVESADPVVDFQIQTTSGFVNVTKALNDLDLFYSGDWKYKQEGRTILVYGIGHQEQTTRKDSDNWQFLTSEDIWAPNSLQFMEHPVTKNWFPAHPELFRKEDGWIGFNYDGLMKVRSTNPTAMQSLSNITVKINGDLATARRVDLPNTLDDKGLWFHLDRRDTESNADFSEAILNASWFRNQTKSGLRNFLSSALRTGQTLTINTSLSGFTIPASATGYTVRDLHQYAYVQESYLNPDVDSSSTYRTIFTSGDLGCGYVRGLKTDFTNNNGVIEFDTYVQNTKDQPYIHWRVGFWNQSGSSVTFSDNFSHTIPDLVVFFPYQVRVNKASQQTLKKSYNRTAPIFRWRSYIPDATEIPQGLASFDF